MASMFPLNPCRALYPNSFPHRCAQKHPDAPCMLQVSPEAAGARDGLHPDGPSHGHVWSLHGIDHTPAIDLQHVRRYRCVCCDSQGELAGNTRTACTVSGFDGLP